MSAAGCSCHRYQRYHCLPKPVPLVPVGSPHPVLLITSGMSQRQRYCGCGGSDPNISTESARVAPRCGRLGLTSPMAISSAHTASPPPPSRTPAGSRASSRYASIAPRTTSARGPQVWAAPRTRTHRSIPASPTPAGASRLPRAVPYPTLA
jgi:hypothetical protein